MTINKIEKYLQPGDVEKTLRDGHLLNSLLPNVYRTKGDVDTFDPIKIQKSIESETGLSSEIAQKITESVVRRIISSGVSFLSGPHIRELVCSALSEYKEEEARKQYTRIGMPLMDYHELLTEGVRENANQYSNPESIHTWAADRISSEYSLLRLLSSAQADAHLRGDIHVHMLRYFDLRPFCSEWDARIILRHGLPPMKWAHSAISRPANSAMVAVLHLAKWLGIVQGEFSGGQGYDNFTTVVAPYLVGLSDAQIKQVAQCFIFETNQIYAARGAQVPFTSISCTPAIADTLADIEAVGPGGKTVGVYSDYEEECVRFFRALTEVYTEGDGDGKLFTFPKHEVKLKPDWLEKYKDEYLGIMKEAAKMGTPYFLNMCADWMPEEIHSQCCRIILTPDGMRQVCDDPEAFDWAKSWMNMGSLQSVSLNLPRLAYEAKGNDARLTAILQQRMDMARDILLIKYDLIKARIAAGKLPICGATIAGQPMLDFRKQSLSIGFVGLNEMLQYHTGYELHQDPTAFALGKRIIQQMADKCEVYTTDHGIKFSLWEQPAESAANRFALLDLYHYPKQVIYQGNRDDGTAYYTNSCHLNYAAEVPLHERVVKQAEFHPIIKGGVITHLWLGEQNPDIDGLWDLTRRIATKTKTAYFAYTFDYTYCMACSGFEQGIRDQCPRCGATGDAIEWYSRITGYYSRVNRFNKGKLQEWRDRRRYNY